MERYAEYKDSGVEWIGDIPCHWLLGRIGSYFSQRNETVSEDDFIPLSVTMNGVVPQMKGVAKTMHGANRKLVRAGDFVINSRSDRKRASGVSYLDGSVSVINMILTPQGIEGPFCHHLFRSEPFVEEFYRNGKGIVADLWSTRFTEMRVMFFPLPPKSEQEMISRFLDERTGWIYEAVKKTEKKIALLKEQRASLINEVVTKGLDPNVEMKDSGVEWIGDIPCHWVISKFKYDSVKPVRYGLNISSSNYCDTGVRFLRITDISEDGRVKGAEGKYLSQSDVPDEFLLERNDVLFCRSGHTVGKSLLFQEDGEYTSGGYLVRFNFGCDVRSKFISYVAKSDFYWSWIKLSTTVSTIENVNGDKYQNFDYPRPLLDEQERIVAFLDERTGMMDEVIAKEEERMVLLKEYRQSLISEVVTGKRKVLDEPVGLN